MATLTAVAAPVIVTGGTVTLTPTSPPSPPAVPGLASEGTLYWDFGFASLDGGIDDSQSTIIVDDVTQFPSNALLAKGPLWLTIESDLSHPPTFEIVKLTSVDSGTNTLTVERGQLGSVGQAHDDATLIKGSMTAEMIRRVRGTFYGDDGPPTPDADLWSVGDRYYSQSEGQWYRFVGQAQFAQANFTGDNNDNLENMDWLAPAKGTNPGGATSFYSVPWRNVTGGFGTPPAFLGQYAIPKSQDSDDVALALFNQGQDDYWMFDANLTVGSSSDVDAGFVFGMDAAGKNGYYLQVMPGSLPTLYSVLDGVPTSLGTIGPDNVVAGEQVFVIVWRRPSSLVVWYQNQANSVNSWYEFEDFGAPTSWGANTGFFCKGAACLGDADLAWTYVESFTYANPPYMQGAGGYLFNNTDTAGTQVDSPTSIELRNRKYMIDTWSGLNGSVWGIVTNVALSDQHLVYNSGATDDVALVGVDIGSQDFDITAASTDPISSSCDYGFWLRGTPDGQNGWYLRLTGDAELIAVVDGVEVPVPLTSGSAPRVAGLTIQTRVVMSRDQIGVYDASYTPPQQIMSATLPPAYWNLGGTTFGWMYRNNDAIIDTQLGLHLVTHNIQPVLSGWQAEPTYRVGSGTPNLHPQQPFGSMWMNLDNDQMFVSRGDGSDYVPISIIMSSGDPAGDAIYGQLYADLSSGAIWIYTGGGVWTQIGNITGGGGGGGGGASAYGMTIDGIAGETFASPITTPAMGDLFIGQNGALTRFALSGGGGFAPNQTLMNPFVLAGSNDSWNLVGDATLDLGTGIASLNTASNSSVGGIVHASPVVLTDFCIRWTADVPDGDGFALAFLQEGTLLDDGTLPTQYSWQGGSLSTTADSMGLDTSNIAHFMGIKFSLTNGVEFFGAPGSDYRNNTFTPTSGSHDWEVRIELGDNQSRGGYYCYVLCDGALCFTQFFELTGVLDAGHFGFFSIASASGTASVNTISNFVCYAAQGMTRIHLDNAALPWFPLTLNSPWTDQIGGNGYAAYRFEGSRIFLRGQVGTGDSSIPIFAPSRKMNRSGFHDFYVPVVVDGSSVMPLAITGSGPQCPAYTGTEVLYLDGINWEHLV